MIKSMTGFGQAQYGTEGYDTKVEIKSVNHRFLDVNIRIPRRYMLLEERIQQFIKQYAARGRFDLNIKLDAIQQASAVKVDKTLALAYHQALKELAETLDIPFNLKIMDYTRFSDVIRLEEPEENLDEVWDTLKVPLAQALEQLVEMRIFEGQKLVDDITGRVDVIAGRVNDIEARSPEVEENCRKRLNARLEEVLPQSFIEPQRIIQEVAIFSDKISIAEEITRLRSHIQQFRDMLAQGDSIGRKSDFLLQEMFREINTVASKANDAVMAAMVVDVKAELEKIREQIQNIE